MATKYEPMDARPDGRLYSRVTRRSVTILQHIPTNTDFSLSVMAESVHNGRYPEFMVVHDGRLRPVKAPRIQDYLSFLVRLGPIVRRDRLYRLHFRKPRTDAHWTQRLADLAQSLLAEMVTTPGQEPKPGQLPDSLERERKKFHQKRLVPTLRAVIDAYGIQGSRQEEVFRWALYMYTDGEACRFDVRQFPHLVPR